ncbi:hypothetical protein EVG20_g1016 [Dentipellis fragilis]|uniref:Uncharacterized protein n=1 Tax=Dentipellis fragilis TaxID=205917 RepID=A0A4Y9ZAU4_9AGAM|nr:hypothetical protein EVG20_g1016 [Dentipellis fragilis]
MLSFVYILMIGFISSFSAARPVPRANAMVPFAMPRPNTLNAAAPYQLFVHPLQNGYNHFSSGHSPPVLPALPTGPYPSFRHRQHRRRLARGPSIVFVTLGCVCGLVAVVGLTRCVLDWRSAPQRNAVMTASARQRLLREMADNSLNAERRPRNDSPAPPPYDDASPPSYTDDVPAPIPTQETIALPHSPRS